MLFTPLVEVFLSFSLVPIAISASVSRDLALGLSTTSLGNTTTVQKGAGDDGLLPTEEMLEERVVEPSSQRTKRLPAKLFVIPASTVSKRQSRDTVEEYTLTYSHDAITTDNNRTLYAPSAGMADVRALLANAVRVGNASQDSTAFADTFNSTLGNLTLIMNAVGSTPQNPTFDWATYAEVAAVLLADTIDVPRSVTSAWVGVVKSLAGDVKAELGVVPRLVIERGGSPTAVTSSPSSSSSSSPAPATSASTALAEKELKSREDAPTVRVSVKGSALTLLVVRQTVTIAGARLVQLARDAVNTIGLEPGITEITGYLTRGTPLSNFQPLDEVIGMTAPNAFNVVAVQSVRISHGDMLSILRTIVRVVETYTRHTSDGTRRHTVAALQGQVLDAAGGLLLTWSLGGAMGDGPLCPSMFVENPDGGTALACIRA
ncbi:MAG: hypothetical protein M1817_003650 [Caeruleum heppii]|nr:MAG: hypothetical protein M1817_003650 [Caeruleum heppii]